MNGQGLSTKGVLFSERRRLLRKLTFPFLNALVWWWDDHLVLVYPQFIDPRRVTRLQLPLNLRGATSQTTVMKCGVWCAHQVVIAHLCCYVLFDQASAPRTVVLHGDPEADQRPAGGLIGDRRHSHLQHRQALSSTVLLSVLCSRLAFDKITCTAVCTV